MKRIIVLLITISIWVVVCIPSFAQIPEIVKVRWTNIATMSNDISFTGTDGSVYTSIKGKSGTTSISGTVSVYRQSGSNWIYVTSISDTTSSIRLRLGCSFTGISGAYYKSVFVATVTINGVDETETKTDYATCP